MWDFVLQWTLQRWFKLSHSWKQESCSRVMVIANLHWCRHHLWHQDPVVTCQGLRVTQSWRVYDDVELVLILTISDNDGTANSTMPWNILRPRPSGALPPPPSGEPSFPQHGDGCRFFTIANQPIRPPVTNSQAVHRTFCLSKSGCSKYKPFAMAGTIWKQLQRKSTSQCLERKHWIVLIFYLGILFFLISWNSGIKILVNFQFSAFLRRGKIQVGHSTGSCAIWKLNKFVTRMEEQLEKSIAALQVWMFHPWIYLQFTLLLRCRSW